MSAQSLISKSCSELQSAKQLIVCLIGDLRSIEHVVEVVVLLQLLAQRDYFGSDRLGSGHSIQVLVLIEQALTRVSDITDGQ